MDGDLAGPPHDEPLPRSVEPHAREGFVEAQDLLPPDVESPLEEHTKPIHAQSKSDSWVDILVVLVLALALALVLALALAKASWTASQPSPGTASPSTRQVS